MRPGPLAPSPDLRTILATLGALRTLDPERGFWYGPTRRVLPLAEVTALEHLFDLQPPVDLLVLATLRVPILERALGVLGEETAALPVDDDAWVTAWAADPFAMRPASEDKSYQQVATFHVCLPRRAPSALDPRVLVVSADDETPPREMLLSQLLWQRLEERFATLDEDDQLSTADLELQCQAWREAKAHPLPPGEVAAAYAAELTGEQPPVLEIRVTHPTLGPGTIVQLLAGGEIAEVDFDSGARKKIKCSFLEGTGDQAGPAHAGNPPPRQRS